MKRILLLSLCLLLLLCAALPVYAEELTLTVPGEGSGAYVVDKAGLLSSNEQARLETLAAEISRRQRCDVVIVTVEGLGGKSAEAFADDYFDYNGYGYGPERSGILFLLSMADRDWALSTRGDAIQVFTDTGLQYLFSKCRSALSNDRWAKAFEAYLQTADTMLSAYNGTLSDEALEEYTEDYNDFAGIESPRQKPGIVKTTVLALLIGFVLALIFSGSLRAELRSVRMKYDASNYQRQNSMHLDRTQDIYLYANVTSRVIETERSGGGGSSTHISSSGATHGGASGKF